MTDKLLSEQIEQADASEFVDYAWQLFCIIHPESKEEGRTRWTFDCRIPFVRHLQHESGHIAAAIKLVKSIGWGYQIRTPAKHEIDAVAPSAVIWGQGDDDWFSATHKSEKMALLAVIAKKLESE